MIKVEKTVYNKEVREITVENGVTFIEVIEDDIISKTKLDLTDEGYKFTRVVNNAPNMAIIHKEGSKSLPWILEKYFTGIVKGNVITEEEFESYKSEVLKAL